MLGEIMKRMQGEMKRINTRRLLKSKQLKISTSKLSLPVHNYIEFKYYTGNEILYSLKDCGKLRPGELSSAILQLGLRKGTPEGFDWNSHPCMVGALKVVKEKIPQYSCRVLTSLALGFKRLEIKDAEVWTLLARHIQRTITSIDPTGLAYCFTSFSGKGMKEFYGDLVQIAGVHMMFMAPKDVINVVLGMSEEGIEDCELFEQHVYPYMAEKMREFSVSQIQTLIKLCENRKMSDELREKLLAYTEKRLSDRKTLSFGGQSPLIK
jgi:hypothetical protein